MYCRTIEGIYPLNANDILHRNQPGLYWKPLAIKLIVHVIYNITRFVSDNHSQIRACVMCYNLTYQCISLNRYPCVSNSPATAVDEEYKTDIFKNCSSILMRKSPSNDVKC